MTRLEGEDAKEFLSTLPRGERLDPQATRPADLLFLSTLPRGERRSLLRHGIGLFGRFYPRSRAGSDI